MEELERRRKVMLTTGKWCNPVNNMLHCVKWIEYRDWALEVCEGWQCFGPTSR